MVVKSFYLYKRQVKAGVIWYAQFTDPATGKRKGSARSTGQSNKTAAAKWAALEVEKTSTGDSTQTLGEWAEPFFGPDCPHAARLRDEGRRYSPAHQANCLSLRTAWISPDPICHKRLCDLLKTDILAFRARLIKKMGKTRTTQRTMSVLQVIVSEAGFHGFITHDLFFKLGQVSYEAKPRTALSLGDLKKILDPGKYQYPVHYEATLCAALTGMRAGEIRALRWGDVSDNTITVSRNAPGSGTDETDPKWGKTRICPYPTTLSSILEPRRGKPEERVFTLRKGHILCYLTWRRAVSDIGVPGASLHALRHTLNSMLRGSGIPDDVLRGSFGWSDASTQEGYTHRETYDYSDQKKAIDKLFEGDV
jgi:integrase